MANKLSFFHWQGWLGSLVVSVLDSGAEGHGFKSQPRCCRVTVLVLIEYRLLLLPLTVATSISQPTEAASSSVNLNHWSINQLSICCCYWLTSRATRRCRDNRELTSEPNTVQLDPNSYDNKFYGARGIRRWQLARNALSSHSSPSSDNGADSTPSNTAPRVRCFLRCDINVWLGSRVVSMLDSGAEGPGSNRSRDAVG